MTVNINEIDERIAQLKKQRAELLRKEKRGNIRQLVKQMISYEIALEDIQAEHVRQTRGRKPSLLKNAVIDKAPIPPKYRDPDSGATWSGRGVPPRWIRSAEEEGVSRDVFLIQQEKNQEVNQSFENQSSTLSDNQSQASSVEVDPSRPDFPPRFSA